MSEAVASFVRRNADIDAAVAGSRRERCSIEQFSGGSLLSVDTCDFDEFRYFAKGWTIEYQLRGARRPHSHLSGVLTPSLQVAVVQHSMGYCSQGRNPQGTLSITIPFDERPMIYRGRLIDPMQIPLIRSDEGFELVCGSGAHFMVMTVAEDKAEQFAAEVTQSPLMWRHPSDRLRFSDRPHKLRYLDALTDVLMAVKACPAWLNEQQAAALLEEKLLGCLPLDARGESQPTVDASRYRAARHAYRYLHDRIDNLPSIWDLCVVTGASYATLERGFREVYGMSPKALIQELRLSQARSALLHPVSSTTVTAVALRCGFLEFGRFAGQYRQRFGELPSETLRRTRGEFAAVEPYAMSRLLSESCFPSCSQSVRHSD